MDTSKKNQTICSKNLAEIREKLCKNSTNILSEKTGLSPQIISNLIWGRRGIGRKTADRILAAFPEVSPLWFYKGEGPMMLSGDVTISGDNSGNVATTGGTVTTIDKDVMQMLKDNQRERLELLAIIRNLTEKQ